MNGGQIRSRRSGATLADLEAAYQDRVERGRELRSARRYVFGDRPGTLRPGNLAEVADLSRLELELLPKACKTHDLEGLMVVTGLSERSSTRGNDSGNANWDALAAFSKMRSE